MDRITVITDVDTKLGFSILNAFFEHGEKIIGISPVKKDEIRFTGASGFECYEWNRSSPIGSRSAVVEILTKYKRIDELVVVQSIRPDSVTIEETDSALINKAIDYWVKGNLFITREALRLFSEKKTGSLVVVNHLEESGKKTNVMSEVIYSACSGLVSALLSHNAGRDVRINGIESRSENTGALAEFVLKSVTERFRKTSGKLLSYNDQKGLFDRLKR